MNRISYAFRSDLWLTPEADGMKFSVRATTAFLNGNGLGCGSPRHGDLQGNGGTRFTPYYNCYGGLMQSE